MLEPTGVNRAATVSPIQAGISSSGPQAASSKPPFDVTPLFKRIACSYFPTSHDLNNIVHETSYNNGTRRQGKVRDVYDLNDGRLLLVSSDRLSAFDRFVTDIPYKGQVLNKLSSYWLEQTRDVVDNHLIAQLAPNISLVRKTQPIPLEVVVRGNLAGSLWQEYKTGTASTWQAAGDFKLPKGLTEFAALPGPIVTPTTKEAAGHDLPISGRAIVEQNILSQEQWDELCTKAKALFQRGQEIAAKRGLILADTKYEFGLDAEGKILLIDEIHTPDSSRYWQADTYAERIAQGQSPESFDKDVLRNFLRSKLTNPGDDPLPEIPDELRLKTALTYMHAYEQITGNNFTPRKDAVTQEGLTKALSRV